MVLLLKLIMSLFFVFSRGYLAGFLTLLEPSLGTKCAATFF
jgi:hypothetical protein